MGTGVQFATRVIHLPTNIERRQRLDFDLRTFEDLQYVTAEVADPLLPKYLYSGGSSVAWAKKFSLLYPDLVYRLLTTAEVNNFASHYLALASFSSNWCLVLEDDALVPLHFKDLLVQIINELPSGTDVVYVGGGFPHSQVLKPISLQNNLLRCEHPCTNTSCAYLISRKAALRALPSFYSFDAPIDVEFALIQKDLNLSVLHLYPYIVFEGSKSIYRSTILRE